VSLSAQIAITSDHIPGSITSTVSLPVGATLGTIDFADVSGGPDDDYYEVVLNGGDKYTFIASPGVSATDTLDSVFVRLHDFGGAILSTGLTSACGSHPTFDFSVAGSGQQTYYLAISAANPGQTGQYSISLNDDGP